MAFRVWMLGGNLPHFTIQDNPASFSDSLSTRVMTYSYLVAFNSWLLMSPSVLSYDWQMGSIPLVESPLDSRNLGTLMFAMIAVLLVYYAVFSNKILVNSGFYIHLRLAYNHKFVENDLGPSVHYMCIWFYSVSFALYSLLQSEKEKGDKKTNRFEQSKQTNTQKQKTDWKKNIEPQHLYIHVM